VTKRRTENWIIAILLGLGLIPAAIMALWGFMAVTARRLHPDRRGVASVARTAPDARWADAVEQGRQIVRAHLVERNLPGLSVAVGAGGRIVWAEGFGWADVDRQIPLSPSDRLRIGSAAPLLTSAAVGLLVDQKRLRLDDEVQTYVAEFPKKPWPVTVRQIMAHVSGLRSDGGDEGPLFSQRCDHPSDAFPFFADRPLLFEPGTQFRYSRYGWIVVSAAVEAAAGEPFHAFMRQHVFDPLGMHETMAETAIPSRPTFYFPRFAADPRYGADVMREINLSCYAGAMDVLSTPTDLVAFAMALDAGALLRPDTVRLLQTPQRLSSGQHTTFGLGWTIETAMVGGEPMQVVGGDGASLGGMVASVRVLRPRGIVVAALANMSYADTASLVMKIAGAFAAAAPD
jgi:CubicO group peptidase (beta-lactamase class C family)